MQQGNFTADTAAQLCYIAVSSEFMAVTMFSGIVF